MRLRLTLSHWAPGVAVSMRSAICWFAAVTVIVVAVKTIVQVNIESIRASMIQLPFPDEHATVASLSLWHPRFRMIFPASNYNNLKDIVNVFSEREYSFFYATLTTAIALASKVSECLVIDIGMNVGYTALLANSLGCRVEGVEASPKTHAYLRENIRLNQAEDRIIAHCAAVSRSSPAGSTVPFTETQTGLTNFVDLRADSAAMGFVRVPVIKSLPAISTAMLPVLIKIDVEGFELSAILTVRHLLGKVPYVLFEWDPDRIRKRDADGPIDTARARETDPAASFLSTLRGAGYEILHTTEHLHMMSSSWRGALQREMSSPCSKASTHDVLCERSTSSIRS